MCEIGRQMSDLCLGEHAQRSSCRCRLGLVLLGSRGAHIAPCLVGFGYLGHGRRSGLGCRDKRGCDLILADFHGAIEPSFEFTRAITSHRACHLGGRA